MRTTNFNNEIADFPVAVLEIEADRVLTRMETESGPTLTRQCRFNPCQKFAAKTPSAKVGMDPHLPQLRSAGSFRICNQSTDDHFILNQGEVAVLRFTDAILIVQPQTDGLTQVQISQTNQFLIAGAAVGVLSDGGHSCHGVKVWKNR